MIDYLNSLAMAEWSTWGFAASPPLSWVVLTNGGSALHDNVVFLGVPQGSREPVLVAKTCRWPAHNETIEQEFRQLTAVWQQLDSAAKNTIPRPLHLGHVGQSAVLVTDFFTGQEMTPLLKQWAQQSDGNLEYRTAFAQIGRWLRDFHEQTAVFPPTTCSPFPHYAALFCEMFALDAAEQAALSELVAIINHSQQQASSQVLQHGDFWPGNIILRAPAQKLAFIDWQFSRWTTNASHDVYFLPLASAAAITRHSETAVHAQQLVQQLNDWHQTWLPAYFNSYGQPTNYSLLPPETGYLAACVEAAARPMAIFGVQQDDAPLWRMVFRKLIN